jgi:acyl-coenzyme A thioesterase PaaI-like protein
VLSISFTAVEKAGKIVTRLRYQDILLGNRLLKVLHGGAVAGYLERTGNLCAVNLLQGERGSTTKQVLSKSVHSDIVNKSGPKVGDGNGPPSVATVDFDINYLKGAPMGSDLVCDAIVSSRTTRLIRVDFICYNSDRTIKVAAGAGLYLIQ